MKPFFTAFNANRAYSTADGYDYTMFFQDLIDKTTALDNYVKDQTKAIEAAARMATDLLMKEPSLLDVEAPVVVISDLHGQMLDLLRIFDRFGKPPKTRYLFMGKCFVFGLKDDR